MNEEISSLAPCHSALRGSCWTRSYAGARDLTASRGRSSPLSRARQVTDQDTCFDSGRRRISHQKFFNKHPAADKPLAADDMRDDQRA